jgi:lipoprotein NlpD
VPALPPATPPAAAPAATAPAAKAAEGITLSWPAKGNVITQFADPGYKGIALSGSEGDPVSAAADGRVVYSGNGLRGYGNLVIVKHDGDFLTAYAHNKSILVTEGQQVKRGQKIAELGKTDSDQPKLHFEVRKSGKPVDPLKFLAQR